MPSEHSHNAGTARVMRENKSTLPKIEEIQTDIARYSTTAWVEGKTFYTNSPEPKRSLRRSESQEPHNLAKHALQLQPHQHLNQVVQHPAVGLRPMFVSPCVLRSRCLALCAVRGDIIVIWTATPSNTIATAS